MAKILIKESEIKNYVRSLLKEAMFNEVRISDPRDVEERNKMLAGQPYDRSYFQKNGKSWNMEKEYRKQKGFPPLRTPAGGVRPRLIGANGEDMTPENRPEAIEASMEAAKERNRENTGNKYIKKQDREEFAQRNGIDSEKDIANITSDPYANNPEESPETQRWMNMSDEEKAAERERIRKERNQQSQAAAAKHQEQHRELSKREPLPHTSKKELERKIKELEAEKDSLEDNQLNQNRIREIDKFINDYKNIINRYHNGTKDFDANDTVADDTVKNADDIAKRNAQDGPNPYELEPQSNGEHEQDYEGEIDGDDENDEDYGYESDEDLTDIIGGRRGKKKKYNFNNAREMGFGDDDDFMFEGKAKQTRTNKVILKESQLHKIIKESVIKILNTINKN